MTAAVAASDPLLAPLTEHQQHLVDIVADVVVTTRAWPVYQYVEAKMDDLGLDASAVVSSMPAISHGQIGYSPIRRENSMSPDAVVKLTIAGMAHAPALSSTVDMFLRVLAALRDRRVTAAYDPARVIDVVVSGPELVAELGLADHPHVDLLPGILQGEPSTWHGAGSSNAGGWTHSPSTSLRRFADLASVDDYLTRMRTFVMPEPPAAAPAVSSPLSLAAAFDYLDVVWRLEFGDRLVVLPSAERTTKLALEANTADEFDSRLSALGEVLKGLRVPGDTTIGTLVRLDTFLTPHLSAEGIVRVRAGLKTLQRLTRIRNAAQHAGAATSAAKALPAFGLTYPVTDFSMAWHAVQRHVVDALEAIRDEVSSRSRIVV